MDREDLLDMAGDPGLIPGIHNYCDRWCERCGYTDRCLTYVFTESITPAQRSDPSDQETVWDDVKGSLRISNEMLFEAAEQLGIDLNEGRVPPPREVPRRARAREQSAARKATQYARKLDAWFAGHSDAFRNKENMLNSEDSLGIGEPLVAAAEILEAVDILRWYQFFIGAKIARALDGRKEEEIHPELCEGPRDSDGSAKIALIAVDRSIAALETLKRHLGESAEEIPDLHRTLEEICALLETEFPGARLFVRPGFDQEVG